MATKREKKVVVSGVTRDEMEEALGKYAAADARISGINSKMDEEFTKIREKNADALAKAEEEKGAAFERVQVFAVENPDLFSKRKSLETTHGTIGFRTGTPKLKTKKGFTWASVLEMLKSFGKDFVRTTEEVAKDKLLADRDNEKTAAVMSKCGILVTQDEAFYIELKKEE